MTALVGKRCLVVEDEALIVLDLQRMLEEAGAALVVCAHTLAEAEAALRELRFDLAVLDLKLGRGETSLPLAKPLAAAGTPFLFLTGTEPERVQLDGFAGPIVEKPYTKPMLLDAAARALSAAR